MEIGSPTLRAGYNVFDLNMEIPATDAVAYIEKCAVVTSVEGLLTLA